MTKIQIQIKRDPHALLGIKETDIFKLQFDLAFVYWSKVQTLSFFQMPYNL